MKSGRDPHESMRTMFEGAGLPDLGDIEPQFFPGAIVTTPTIALATKRGLDLRPFLRRHLSADWGQVYDDTKEMNEAGIKTGDRLHSCYQVPGQFQEEFGKEIWVISDPTGSPRIYYATTFLFPSEY